MKTLSVQLYCPYCGQPLTRAKWQYEYGNTHTLICPSNHLWDIWGQSDRLHFTPVSLATCQCGETMPSRDMREKVCPKCHEVAKKAWRMDKEKSYARLEITPVKTADGLYYHLTTSIKIEPYPNPFMYGGMWGSSPAKTKEELQQVINGFEENANVLRQNGMEKVEIITHDEVVRAEQQKLEPVAVKAPELKPKTENQKQLSLLE